MLMCTPGEQRACACLAGAQGTQVCGTNGALGVCSCPDGSATQDVVVSGDVIDASPIVDAIVAADEYDVVDASPVVDTLVVTDAADVSATIDQPPTNDHTPAIDVVAVGDLGSGVDSSTSDTGVIERCPSEMVFIPAGTFMMGSTSGDADERPVHQVTLSAYCMDLTEVTVAAYRGCTAPGCSAPDTGGACNWGLAGRDLHPINCVDWNQALAYCRWRGGELPTEAQWEYAARGGDGRTYPWGNAAPAAQPCWAGGGTARTGTCPVGTFPAGNSPFGLMDMAGNVYEWTADWMGPYAAGAASDPTGATSGTFRVFRGGGWGNSAASFMRSAGRDGQAPTYRDVIDGFRCARPSR